MRTKFIYIFLSIGILFAVIAIYFTYQDKSQTTLPFGISTSNENMGLGAIAMAIISASCFIVTGYLIREKRSQF